MDHATSGVPRELPHHILKKITCDFSEERKLGSGAFGKVYKGVYNDGEKIAVKVLYDMPGIDDKQFKNEFHNLASLQHENIVRLVNYCYEIHNKCVEHKGRLVLAEETFRALCFEYMHKGSLDNYLSDEYNGLDWNTRYAIIKGICLGLKYLHEELKYPIYHLDLKPANILLDENMVPKVADFGLSRLFGEEQMRIIHYSGTAGYMPPEYIERNVISNKFDIFSLGVVIIKIMTGPTGYSKCGDMSSHEFIDLVHGNWTNRIRETTPSHMLDSYFEQVKRCIEIALSCLEADRCQRPRIGHIVDMLNVTETMIPTSQLPHWLRHCPGSSVPKAPPTCVFWCAAMFKLPLRLDGLRRRGYMLPMGAEEEIPLVKRDLEEIIAILSKLEDDHATIVRCWMKEVRELWYDVEDFLDQYDHTATGSARSIPVRCNKVITRWRRRYTATSAPPLRHEKLRQRLWVANKIREFSLRAQEALQRIGMYDLAALSGTDSARCNDVSSSSWRPQWSATNEAYVDIGGAMNELEESLMTVHDGEQQKLKVLSIVGFAGIGKTTLANELYSKLGGQFECRAFVRTSQKPDMRRLFTSMLSQVCPHQPSDNWKVHSLISSIKAYLQDKRYLIIIDDLWCTSTWDIITCALPDGNSCSRVLTTTEIEDVALQSCGYDSKYVFKMKPLGEDAARILFFSSLFGPQWECPPELWEISHDIIRKCGGLPLAIVTIASLLASKPVLQEQWDHVNSSLGYSLTTSPTSEGMKQVLNLSYNNLPQHLKACMLYMSIYQEDNIIWKDDLVNQWMAEGFIWATEGQDMQEILGAYFDELISRKMIQPVDIKDNGEVRSCVVHHVVLNHISALKSIEENFVTAIHHSQTTTMLADKVRRLSLHFGNEDDAMPPTNMRLSQVRTFAFFGVFKCVPSIADFRLLKVLILHFWGDEDNISLDLTRISELFRLRYLKVTSNVTIDLKIQMRGLQHLETIKIDARVSSVPSEIAHLPGLLHLSLTAETGLPNGIGHMTSLRTLGYFDLIGNSMENVQSLSKLTNLRDLQLTSSTMQPYNLNNKMQLLLGSILGRLNNLKSLTLVPTDSYYVTYLDDAAATDMTISGYGLSIPSSPLNLLQRLNFSPRICVFYRLPMFIGQLRNLCVLKIGVREIVGDDVNVLRGLPALCVLSLYVHIKPAERIVIGKTGFWVLKYFKFRCCDPQLTFDADSMRNLLILKLCFNAPEADQLSRIPVGIKNLSSLKEVSAEIGGAPPDESDRRAAELAFRDAIRVHPRCPRVSVKCVNQIFGSKEDHSSMT